LIDANKISFGIETPLMIDASMGLCIAMQIAANQRTAINPGMDVTAFSPGYNHGGFAHKGI
jgi:hypothetical protein